MLSAAESKHLFNMLITNNKNEEIEMLRLRCAALSMTTNRLVSQLLIHRHRRIDLAAPGVDATLQVKQILAA
jgi:hypothetical protein